MFDQDFALKSVPIADFLSHTGRLKPFTTFKLCIDGCIILLVETVNKMAVIGNYYCEIISMVMAFIVRTL